VCFVVCFLVCRFRFVSRQVRELAVRLLSLRGRGLKDSEVGTGLLMAIIALVIAIPVVIIVVMVIALRKRGRKVKPPLPWSSRFLLPLLLRLGNGFGNGYW